MVATFISVLFYKYKLKYFREFQYIVLSVHLTRLQSTNVNVKLNYEEALNQAVDSNMREEQVGFRQGRGCSDQILSYAPLLKSAKNGRHPWY